MDDFDIVADESLSQYSATPAASGQEIDESTGTHGSAGMPANNDLQDADTTEKIDEQTFFFARLKTIFEVSDERTAEEARKFLKVNVKLCRWC